MPRMIGLFRQKYPDVSVQLQVHSTRRTGWSVANGQIDLAIIGGELPPELMEQLQVCLLYTSPSPRDKRQSRMPSSA